MGLETRLFEIDPKSTYFDLLSSHRNYADSVILLESRYKYPELYFQQYRSWIPDKVPRFEFEHEVIRQLHAIEELVASDPRLMKSWINLRRSGFRLAEFLGVLAEACDQGIQDLAPIIIFGVHAPSNVTPGQHADTRWVDVDRCGRIAEWLDTLTEEAFQEAYDNGDRWPSGEELAAQFERQSD